MKFVSLMMRNDTMSKCPHMTTSIPDYPFEASI